MSKLASAASPPRSPHCATISNVNATVVPIPSASPAYRQVANLLLQTATRVGPEDVTASVILQILDSAWRPYIMDMQRTPGSACRTERQTKAMHRSTQMTGGSMRRRAIQSMSNWRNKTDSCPVRNSAFISRHATASLTSC